MSGAGSGVIPLVQVLELAQELEATQQLLQQQQEAAAAHATSLAKPRSSEHDVPALSNIIVDLRVMVAAMEQRAAAADKKVGIQTHRVDTVHHGASRLHPRVCLPWCAEVAAWWT